MRYGDVRVDGWDVSEIEVGDENRVRLDMWTTAGTHRLVYFREDDGVLEPCGGTRLSESYGWGLVDSEIVLAERILERRGYTFPETME
jgi:hypothetical protein